MVLVQEPGMEIHVPNTWNIPLYECFGIYGWMWKLAHMYMGYDFNFREVSCGTVIDIGANVGEFSLYCSFFGHRVFAVEPDRRNFSMLEKNTQGHSIECRNIGIWNESSRFRFYSAVDTNLPDSSFIEPEKYDTFYDVDAVTFDLFCKRESLDEIFIIKCDAEGGEPEVFSCAEETLARTHYVAVDVSSESRKGATSEPMRHILENAGFDTSIFTHIRPSRLFIFGHNRRFLGRSRQG